MKTNIWILWYLLIINALTLNAQKYNSYTVTELDSICEVLKEKRAFIEGYKFALLLVKKTKDKPEYIQALFTLAVFQKNKSAYEAAEETYYQLLSLLENEQGKLNYIKVNIYLGNIYYTTGRIKEAEFQLMKAQRFFKKYAYKKDDNYYNVSIDLLNSLGAVYLGRGKFIEAEEAMLGGINVIKERFGEKNERYIVTLTNLGVIYETMGFPEKAQRKLAKALTISRAFSEGKHSKYSHLLLETARLYYMYGEVEKGEKILRECFDTLVNNWGYKNEYTLRATVSLGALNYFKQDYLKSLSHVKECFSINAMTPIDTSSWENLFENLVTVDFLSLDVLTKIFLVAEYSLIRLYNKGKETKWLEYLYHLYKAQNEVNNKTRSSFRTGVDKLKLMRENAVLAQKGVEVSIDLGGDAYLKNAFLFAEENKSALWAQQLRKDEAKVFGNISSDLLEKEQHFQKKMTQIMGQLTEAETQNNQRDSLIKVLNEINQNIVKFQKDLKREYPKYYNRKYSNKQLSVDDLQHLLTDDQVILEYLVTKSTVYIFVITQKTLNVIPLSISKKELGQKIAELRLVLTNSTFIEENEAYRQYCRTAYWFYEKLMKKALDTILNKPVNQLIIIPDGELGHLPFETFLTNLPDTTVLQSYNQLPYLLRNYEISYSYSAALWQENKKNQQANSAGEILAYAPLYANELDEIKLLEKTSMRLIKIRKGLRPLLENIIEVNTLSQRFGGTFRTKEAATEHQFKQDLSSHSIIHLATHGILNEEYPILSSLAFTEVGDSLEDGFLQAYEISQMDIKSQLVVLSACETGFGKFEQGEGIMSLARSFMYAGAPSLVVSLWQVNDLSTSVIMQLFYEGISKGQQKSKALQKAKLAYLEGTEGFATHPIYWAPFIQLGNNQPIVLYEKGRGWIRELLIGFGILALLIVGKLYWSPRKES